MTTAALIMDEWSWRWPDDVVLIFDRDLNGDVDKDFIASVQYLKDKDWDVKDEDFSVENRGTRTSLWFLNSPHGQRLILLLSLSIIFQQNLLISCCACI